MNEALLDKKLKYIVGVSGGNDSMALLNMLNEKGYLIYVCHVNYHIRHDSNEDQVLVEKYCKSHQIPYFIKEVDLHDYHEDNLEMKARLIRYDFYREIGKLHHIHHVILAHHLGDVLETMIMQLQRGNVKGYLGIQEKTVIQDMVIVRPLLNTTKQELRDYCALQHVDYHEDYTNHDDHYRRNAIRLHVLPTYSQQQISLLLKQMVEHNQRIDEQNKQLQPLFDQYNQKHYLSLKDIQEEQLPLVIYYMLKKVIYPPLISDALIQEIIKQIQSCKPNIQMQLPVNFLFIKEYDNIYTSNNMNTREYCIKYEHLVYDRHEAFYLAKEGHLNEGVYLSEKDFPIVIRSFLPGDKIKTSGGTKKVSRLFIDAKIPSHQRKTWPIVVNNRQEVVLIPNLAKNIKYLTTKPNIFVVKL